MKPPKKLYVAEFRLYTKRHQQTEQIDTLIFIALYKMTYFVLVLYKNYIYIITSQATGRADQKEQNRKKYTVIKKYIKKYYHALII
jgi:hypothetical protein